MSYSDLKSMFEDTKMNSGISGAYMVPPQSQSTNNSSSLSSDQCQLIEDTLGSITDILKETAAEGKLINVTA